ncbi:MAG: hypothetical protein GTN76_10625 [Candidatus Aenigmarchaeota archaeon]|nr:hypothetical protein [Candidatus Aenigmarchaeota archaeon]
MIEAIFTRILPPINLDDIWERDAPTSPKQKLCSVVERKPAGTGMQISLSFLTPYYVFFTCIKHAKIVQGDIQMHL